MLVVTTTIKAFGDESADATKELVFAVAAVFGTEDEWALAIREWLRRTRGLPFHATDCDTEFVRHPEKFEENRKLYTDLTQILARSYLVGFAVALNLKSYLDVFPGMDTEWAYFKALADVIGAAARTAKRFNATGQADVTLEFTFDSRLESNGTAGTMYTALANQPEWAGSGIFDTKIVFEGGVGKSPRLEIGDLLARESMKELERKITNIRPSVRRSRHALDETKKFIFLERDREYWDELKAMCELPESDVLMKEFQQWLISRGKVQHGRTAHTLENWFLFNAWLDNRDAVTKASVSSLSVVS